MRGFNAGGVGLASWSAMVADLTSGLVLELWGTEEDGEVGGVDAGEPGAGSFAKLSLLRSI